jgi:hypothetical protein
MLFVLKKMNIYLKNFVLADRTFLKLNFTGDYLPYKLNTKSIILKLINISDI